MALPEHLPHDIFAPNGRLRPEVLTESARQALEAALRLTHETQWETVRSPHLFMGLLAVPDESIRRWAKQWHADLENLLAQFQHLFHQPEGDPEAVVCLNREFLSDNVLRMLREAAHRAWEHKRPRITPMDLLISLLTTSNSIVAECFERIGVTAARLTELAVIAEQNVPEKSDPV